MKPLDRWLQAGRPTACDVAPRVPLSRRYPVAAPVLGFCALITLVPLALTGLGFLLALALTSLL